MGDRCTGHCCMRFFLPYSPERIQDEYRRWQAIQVSGEERHELRMNLEKTRGSSMLIEIHLIAPMVTAIEEHEKGHGWWYRCKHFDEATNNCTIYEIRPVMCREYPYGRRCEYKECTWDEVRKAADLGACP